MNITTGSTEVERKHPLAGSGSGVASTEYGRKHVIRGDETENKVVLPPLTHQIHTLKQNSHVLAQPLLKSNSNIASYRYMPSGNPSPTNGDGYNFLLNKPTSKGHIYTPQVLHHHNNQLQHQMQLKVPIVADDALEAAKLVVNFSNNQGPLANSVPGNGYLSVFHQQHQNSPMVVGGYQHQNQGFGSASHLNRSFSSVGLTPTDPSISSSQPLVLGLLEENEMKHDMERNVKAAQPLDYEKREGTEYFKADSGSKVSKLRKKETCAVCNQTFSNLRTHMASHLDAKARPFKCGFCFRGFARNNDLQRHQKKHLLERNLSETTKDSVAASQELMSFLNAKNSKKKNEKNVCATPLGFQCPFFLNNEEEIGYPDDEDYVPNRCHTTGIFTRCDTFKNHLKALHFRYPKGTNRKSRPNVEGYCKHCSEKYSNCKKWVDEHVLTGKCLKDNPFKSHMEVSQTGLETLPSRPPTTPSMLDLNNI
ncbi:hypothetical protein QEN19_002551 [Hanseniaspora menglaensis]